MITFTSTTIDLSFFLLLSSLKTLLPSHFSNPSLIFSLQTFLPSSSLIFPMYPSFIFFKTSLPLPSSFYLFLPSFLSFFYLFEISSCSLFIHSCQSFSWLQTFSALCCVFFPVRVLTSKFALPFLVLSVLTRLLFFNPRPFFLPIPLSLFNSETHVYRPLTLHFHPSPLK